MAESKTSKSVFQQKAWFGGISNFLKEPQKTPISYYYSQCIDTRTDPYALKLHNATTRESGSVVTDLLKFADTVPLNLVTYAIGDTGNFYSRSSAGSWSKIAQMTASHGNGLTYFAGDEYVYFTGDTAIGRYGPLSSSPSFSSDFLTAQAGVPQNTNSLLLASASSHSADAADSASLSITGNLTLEAYVNLNSLPTAGNSMSIMGKWDESGAFRSYLLDIYGVSGVFGDGSDGPLTISSNTTDAPIDSACTGTVGTYVLSATNASFATGQIILIHQTRGTNAGQWEKNVITGYSAGTISLSSPLTYTYTSGAQVLVLRQYTDVTVNIGFTLTAKAWNGTTGGILAFIANGTTTIAGTITATGKGFRGGAATPLPAPTFQGEGTAGAGAQSNSANGNGGGGGANRCGGGGGGHSATGSTGNYGNSGGSPGVGGSTAGSTDLTTLVFGGGGGGGGSWNSSTTEIRGGAGGNGGGIIFIISTGITLSGSVTSNGVNGSGPVGSDGAGGGAGAGGAVLLKAQTATLGSGLITASAASGGHPDISSGAGGDSSPGRVHLDYLTSYTGSTSPKLDATQDNSLVINTTYQVRLGISNDGTNFERYTTNLSSLTTGQWNRFSVAWTASSSQAAFYQNGSLLATRTGALTAIHNNASLLYIGANKGASAIQNFLNGYIDDVRVWSTARAALTISSFNNTQLTGNEGNLAAYYKLNNAATDSTTNANNLTLRNSPSYSSSVPFLDATDRLDIDQEFTTTGSTYTLPTSISEVAADQLPFTPSIDPQKSMDINIDTLGTGDVTITIHDSSNRTIATKTITHANLASSGYQEFVWDTPWRIVIGKEYHAHITVSTGTTKIVSSSLNTLQSAGVATGNFHTYYQYLVTDSLFHPIAKMLNFIVILNERYLATWDGAFYEPNKIAFPPGTHARCYGYWGKYLAIGTWQEAQNSTPTIYDFPTGRIYFWDGISLTFNFSIEVPEGQVNALFGMDSDLYYIAGYKGDLMLYNGGYGNETGNSRGQKIKRNPYLERGKYLEVYPQALTMWEGLLRIGMAANTNSSLLPQGVYSWGTLYPQYQETYTFDYIISTGGVKDNTVKIGMLQPVGQKLLVGWKHGNSTGCDVIDPTGSSFYTQGLIETNIQDGGEIWKNDLLLKIRADHLALATGETVTLGYKADRATSYDISNSVTENSGQKYTVKSLNTGRLTEYQLEALLGGNGSSSPTLLSLAALTDSLDTEEQF